MRKIVVAVASTISALVLLFSYHTSTNSTAAKAGSTDNATEPEATSGATPNAPTSSSSQSTSTGSSGSGSLTDGIYTGDSVDTQWGPVQVQITVSGGKITASDAVVYPTGNRKDQQINAYALPILNQEAVSAQSAGIDAVSGATVTSDGYTASLQSAIDQASK